MKNQDRGQRIPTPTHLLGLDDGAKEALELGGYMIRDITKGKLKSAYVLKPFGNAKRDLEEEGYKIISLEQIANLRINNDQFASVNSYNYWVREGYLYVPRKGIYLTKNSPIIANETTLEEAIYCSRGPGRNVYLTGDQVEKALADSCKLPSYFIPTSRLGEEKITSYLFGKEARDYGMLLKESGINEFVICRCDQILGDKRRTRAIAEPMHIRNIESTDPTSAYFESHLSSFYSLGLLHGGEHNVFTRGVKR